MSVLTAALRELSEPFEHHFGAEKFSELEAFMEEPLGTEEVILPLITASGNEYTVVRRPEGYSMCLTRINSGDDVYVRIFNTRLRE